MREEREEERKEEEEEEEEEEREEEEREEEREEEKERGRKKCDSHSKPSCYFLHRTLALVEGIPSSLHRTVARREAMACEYPDTVSMDSLAPCSCTRQ